MAVQAFFPYHQLTWVADNSPDVFKLLIHHFPDTPNLIDGSHVAWDLLDPVDILVGGYPCQPFSQAGLGRGSDDERYLWPDIRLAIRHLQPRFTILENVAGHRRNGFSEVLADCAEDGLSVRWISVRASEAGAPHKRERLFFLIHHRDTVVPSLGLPAQFPRSPANTKFLPTPVARDWRGKAKFTDASIANLLPTPRRTDYNGAAEHGLGSPDLRTTVALLPTPKRSDSSGGGVHPDRRQGSQQQLNDTAKLSTSERWAQFAPAITRWEQVMGRPAPAPSMPSKASGDPVLNPAFSEWMMGLPQGWVTEVPRLSKSAQLRIIGNGVVPQQAMLALSYLFNGLVWDKAIREVDA